jgi:hypothetical protein
MTVWKGDERPCPGLTRRLAQRLRPAAVSWVALLLTLGAVAAQASSAPAKVAGRKAAGESAPVIKGLLTLDQTLMLKALIRLGKLDDKIDKAGQKLDVLAEAAHTDWVAPFAALTEKVAGFAGGQIVVFNPSRHTAHVWIRVYHFSSKGAVSYENCERDVVPGGVSKACLFYKVSGWGYVHSTRAVVPYGLTFTRSLSPAKAPPDPKPNEDETVQLRHSLMPAKLDWYPFCPRADLIGVKLACQN